MFFEVYIESVDEYKGYRENIKNECMEQGFTEGEATYVVNRISNVMRRKTKGWNAYNFWVEINKKNSEKVGEEIILKSGKIVKFDFNLD
jgi:hypothetical protein